MKPSLLQKAAIIPVARCINFYLPGCVNLQVPVTTGRFGEESYAFEELVAQLGSVFMAKELGVPYDMSAHENSAAYLKSWLSTLKMDKNFLMRASAQASESVKWQLDHLSKYRAAQNETVPSASSAVEAETDMVSAMRPAPTRLGM